MVYQLLSLNLVSMSQPQSFKPNWFSAYTGKQVSGPVFCVIEQISPR